MATKTDEPGSESATLLDVDAIALECRKLGHALVIEAMAQKNEQLRSAGQVRAMTGMLLDGGRIYRAVDASERDGLLVALENARKALAAGFESEAKRCRDQMAENCKASPRLNELLGTPHLEASESPGVPMLEVTANEGMTAIAARCHALTGGRPRARAVGGRRGLRLPPGPSFDAGLSSSRSTDAPSGDQRAGVAPRSMVATWRRQRARPSSAPCGSAALVALPPRRSRPCKPAPTETTDPASSSDQQSCGPPPECVDGPRYRPSAELPKRTFGIDVEACPRCGGRMRLLAVTTDLTSAARFLRHRGEPTERSDHRPRDSGLPSVAANKARRAHRTSATATSPKRPRRVSFVKIVSTAVGSLRVRYSVASMRSRPVAN